MDTPNTNECSLAIGRTVGKRAMLYLGILVFAFALLLLLNSSNASAATHVVSGDVSGTWAQGDTVYVIGDINVPTGQTLNISNGVNVYFDSGTGLTVYGTLNAISTQANAPINFTANTTTPFAGYWTGIDFNAGVGITSVIDTVHIEYSTFGVQSIDSEVNLANATLNDISGAAVSMTRDTSVLPDLSATLHQLVIYNVYDGIVINGIGKNLTVTVDSVTITNVVRWGIHLNADVGSVNLAMSDSTFDNAPYTIEVWGNQSVQTTLTNVAINNTSGEVIGIWSFNGNVNAVINDVTAVNLTTNSGVVVRADHGNSDTTMNGVTVQNRVEGTYGIYFLLSNITTAHLTDVFVEGFYYGIYYDEAGSVSIIMDPSTIIGPNEGYGLWIDAASAELALTDVAISNVSCGISMVSTSGLADLSLVNVLISGTNLNQGIIVEAEEANAVVNISGVTIEMNPSIDWYTYWTNPEYNGISVMANLTIDFVAVDLTVIGGLDCVVLTTIEDGMSVDITGALMMNGIYDGLQMNSGGGLELSIVDALFTIDVDILHDVNYFTTTTAIDGIAVEGIEATLANVETQWVHGVSLVAEQDYINVTMTDVTIEPMANDTFFLSASGIYLACSEGSATVNLANVDCYLAASEYTWYNSGNGIVVEANDTVVFNAVNLTVIGAMLDGVSVISYNGAVEADISLADIENIGGSGMLFYSEYDFVDLTLSDSAILNCSLDGVVAQAVTDVTLGFNNVTVNDTIDGVFALSTDGNVSADFSDVTVMNCETGIRILAPNGWILMVMDPSSVEYVGTGIYLDAMGAVDLSIYDSFVGFAEIGIEIHSFEGGINVLLDNVVLGYNDVYGLFADADNSDIIVTAVNGTIMTENWVGWYLITSNGSVPINLDNITFEYGGTGVWVESSDDLVANVVNSQFLGQEVLGMNLNSDNNITLNVEGSTFDGQIAENAQLFYPSMSEGQYIIIQPEAGNWTTNQSMTATLPFGFDFNGATYDEVLMSLNGWLALGPDGAPDYNLTYSFGPGSPNLIAPAQEYWNASDDLMDGYFHGMGYKYDGELNAVIFQWFVWLAAEPQLKNVFEVILYESGGIEFRYAMMDGYEVTNYAFGINMYDGPNWNLGTFGESAQYMDFQSVFFSTEMMSDGSAISAIAGENMVATIDSSSFSHYLGGGVLLVAVNGSANIDLQGSNFSFIYAITQTMGAFVAAALNNVTTADVSGCSFDTIGTAAIVLFDSPSLGGVDSFLVENNHFNEVIITTAIVSVINDEAQPGSAVYVSNKVFAQNDGTHVGIMAIATVVTANDTAWSIQETDVIENNNFTGEIDPWLLNTMSGMTVPYLGDIDVAMMTGMMNDIFGFESDLGANQIAHSLSVTGNKISEGPIDQYYDLGQPEFGAVTVEEIVALADEASLTIQSNISVIDNEISAYNAPLYSGVEIMIAESLANPVDGLLDSTVNATFVNNTIESWYYGTGLGLYVSQDLNDGKGQGVLNVDVVATRNYVDGFENGLVVAVETSATNLFGDVVSNVDVLVQDNELYAYFQGVVVDLQTSDVFEHYFPPYEQVVESNATMAIDVEIIGNQVSGWNGIYVSTGASATEDEFGVFTDANASITGPVNVLNNNVWVYYTDGYGIDVESSVSAAVSMSNATSDVPVTVVNNSVNSSYQATGISIVNSASTSTMPLRFYDQPTASMISTINVSANTLYGGSGVAIAQSAEATGGESHAVVTAQIDVMDNTMSSIIGTGISVNVSGYTDSIDFYPWVDINADVAITGNNVSCDGGTGISVTVLPDVDNDGYVYLAGLVLIENNNLSGAGIGIYVSTVVPVDIMHNTLTDVVVGISASGYGIHIIENTISGVIEEDGDGIYIEDGNYLTIQGNTISNVGGDGIGATYVDNVLITENTFENIGMSGVYLSGEENTSYYLEVSNNTFTNIGDSGVEVNNIEGLWVMNNTMTNVSYFGVEVNDATNVYIENNTMSEMFGGVYLYDIGSANIMNNVMSAGALAQGGEEEPTLGQGDVGYGIGVDDANTIVATGNEMTGFEAGVEFDYVYDLIFTWNTVTGSLGDGAYFYVNTATISNNVFSDSGLTGVIIENSYMVTFANNEVTNNGLDGLFVVETSYMTIINGMFVDNDMYGIGFLNASGDWVVNAASSVVRNDVLFSGDLTVMEGGSLMLDTVDFAIVPDMRDGVSAINVMAGGALSAIDTEFYATSWYSIDGFGIPYGNYYEFNVYGTLEFVNVHESDALELYLGAGSVNVTIETSTIMYNVKNGIHIVDSSPVIMSCSIVSNPRNGIFIEGGAAAPRITDCIIADNDRGIYALNTKLESVTDNLIVLNSEAGLFADNVSGSIHDNTFLLNHKEIYVRNSNVSIMDNQIGYTPLVQLLAQFVPLLQGFNLSTDIFLPELGLSINSMTVMNIIIGHVGIYAINSEVRTSGNSFGMLSTAVQVVNCDLTFGDDIRQNTIVVPYMDNGGIIRNMSLPIPVWDGIIATNSHVVIRGATIDVLDDAVFLDNSTSTISSSTLKGGDFNLYLINGSSAKVTDTTFGHAGAEDTSAIDVWEKLTVVIKDPWGTALANVPVKVGTLESITDSDGTAVVYVEAYVLTSSGRAPAQPNLVTANFTTVPTTAYPGHSSWSPLVLSKTVSVSGPTTVVLVPSVIVKFDLLAHAIDRDGKSAVNVTVKVFDASGAPAGQAQTNATGIAAFELVSWIKNADGTTDNSMTPYKVTAEIGKDTAQASTNLTGNTNLDVKVDLGPQFNWGPAIIMGIVVVVLVLIGYIVLRRKP